MVEKTEEWNQTSWLIGEVALTVPRMRGFSKLLSFLFCSSGEMSENFDTASCGYGVVSGENEDRPYTASFYSFIAMRSLQFDPVGLEELF